MSGLEHGQLSSWKGAVGYRPRVNPCHVYGTNGNDDIGEEGDRETEPVRAQEIHDMFRSNKGGTR